jgi:hypothetical protein
MENGKSEVERLGIAMAHSARTMPGLMGSVIAVWEGAHPEISATSYLQCSESQLWRIAVTPRPTGGQLVERCMELAADVGVNAFGLVNMLRFAESVVAFEASSGDGEMLMAALDADIDEDGDS